jgi:cytochrome c biogenesis protein CcmG/thiol:disulfide interchange protein DsbE
MNKFTLPVIGFLVLVVFLGIGLTLRPSELPSPLINKPAPQFSLPLLHNPEQRLSTADMKGRVWVVNVWASWCYSCLTEHPYINALASEHQVPVIGLNHKDVPDAAKEWLQRNGNSYEASVMDRNGKVSIDFGVYGVPETFVIDKQGLIRFKHIGPVSRESLETQLLPLIRQLELE